MATPPELYDMCGLSIQIESNIVEEVQTILKEHKISTSGLFWYEKGELAIPYEAQWIKIKSHGYFLVTM